jgi:hypothetical protein
MYLDNTKDDGIAWQASLYRQGYAESGDLSTAIAAAQAQFNSAVYDDATGITPTQKSSIAYREDGNYLVSFYAAASKALVSLSGPNDTYVMVCDVYCKGLNIAEGWVYDNNGFDIEKDQYKFKATASDTSVGGKLLSDYIGSLSLPSTPSVDQSRGYVLGQALGCTRRQFDFRY